MGQCVNNCLTFPLESCIFPGLGSKKPSLATLVVCQDPPLCTIPTFWGELLREQVINLGVHFNSEGLDLDRPLWLVLVWGTGEEECLLVLVPISVGSPSVLPGRVLASWGQVH